MSLADLEKQALALPEPELARLTVSLLRTLSPAHPGPSDEEVLERDAELDSGRAEEISHEEFVRRVERQRGQA